SRSCQRASFTCSVGPSCACRISVQRVEIWLMRRSRSWESMKAPAGGSKKTRLGAEHLAISPYKQQSRGLAPECHHGLPGQPARTEPRPRPGPGALRPLAAAGPGRHGPGVHGPASAHEPRRGPEAHPPRTADRLGRRRPPPPPPPPPTNPRPPPRLPPQTTAPAYAAAKAEDRHFFVMEYVEGTNLARLLKERGALPVVQAFSYARQAAQGLHHAHQN